MFLFVDIFGTQHPQLQENQRNNLPHWTNFFVASLVKLLTNIYDCDSPVKVINFFLFMAMLMYEPILYLNSESSPEMVSLHSVAKKNLIGFCWCTRHYITKVTKKSKNKDFLWFGRMVFWSSGRNCSQGRRNIFHWTSELSPVLVENTLWTKTIDYFHVGWSIQKEENRFKQLLRFYNFSISCSQLLFDYREQLETRQKLSFIWLFNQSCRRFILYQTYHYNTEHVIDIIVNTKPF